MSGAVLFVEDDEPFRTTVARHLRRHGLPVVEARSTEEADRLLAAGLRPGIVLLDLNLPGDAGWDLIRAGSGPSSRPGS